MTCPNPATDGQLTSGDPEGGRSCVAYSASYGLCAVTDGVKTASGRQIRVWTGDQSGGLELQQVDDALRVHEHFNPDTTVTTWGKFEARIDSGKEGAVVIGGYGPISNSKYAGQQHAAFNHAIWVPPSWRVMDPLCDGRHAGVYRYKGEAYPKNLIHDFTAALRLGSGSRAGANHVEASFFPIAEGPQYSVTIIGGFAWYYLKQERIDHRGKAQNWTTAQTFRCTAPRLTRWANDTLTAQGYRPKAIRLATITAGLYKGRSVNVDNPSVTLERLP